MASGGDEPGDIALTECSVCLENISHKDPRTLTCGHSFCTPCIQKLAAKDPITCPICRVETELPNGGVGELPVSDKLTDCEGYCGTCLRHNKVVKATHTCNKCKSHMICGSCADMHSRFPPLMSHQIHVIEMDKSVEDISTTCEAHEQPLDYYCSECQKAICLDCMYINQHKGHEDKITDVDHEVSVLKKVTSDMNQMLLENNLGLNRVIMRFEKCQNDMNVSKEQLSHIEENLEHQLHQVKESKQTIDDLHTLIRSKISAVTDLQNDSASLISEFTNIHSYSGHEYINKATGYKENAEEMIAQIQKPIEGYITAEYVVNDTPGDVGKLETTFHPSLPFAEYSKPFSEYIQEPSLKQPELIREIIPDRSLFLKNPREILSVGDGTVIIVNRGATDLQRIDTKGNIVHVYKVATTVQSAAISGGYMYIASATDLTLTRMALDESSPAIIYKPNVRSISGITVAKRNVIICENCHGAKIVEYNHENSRDCVCGLDYPLFMNTANINNEQIYIVSVNNQTRKVNIYNSRWGLICRIGYRGGSQFVNPSGNAITPGGKVLIADRNANSISEYRLDGSFVKDVLRGPAIDKPTGILYEYPYLWVAEDTPAVKLFRID